MDSSRFTSPMTGVSVYVSMASLALRECLTPPVLFSNYLEKNIHTNAFIDLMPTKGVTGFHEKFDSQKRPNDSPGM